MLIEALDLHKIYDDGAKKSHVLKGIGLSVARGEIVAVIGPSGAGKSTLLNILGTLDAPTKGKVLFDGIDIYSSRDAQRSLIRNRRIGFVFQFYHLLPEFNALENVMMPRLICDSTAAAVIRKEALTLLESLGLRDKAGSRPSQLSGGEAQRVAIARALINKPDIVFCDEPTGNLDSKSSQVILGLMRELNKTLNQTFLIVTHSDTAAAVARRVLRIKDGVLI